MHAPASAETADNPLADALTSNAAAPAGLRISRLERDKSAAGAYDHDGAVQEAQAARRRRKSRGQVVLQVILIGPAVLNWAICCWANYFGTLLVTDSAGVVHNMNLAMTYNYEMVFLLCCGLCFQTVLIHFWVTIGAVATDLQLSTAGSSNDQSFQQRLQLAQEICSRPTKWEWVHVGLVAMDFFFSSVFIFGGVAWYNVWMVAIGPGLACVVTIAGLAKTRVVMLQHLRTGTAEFAQDAVRGLMKVLVIMVVIIFHDIGWWFLDVRTKWPKCPEHYENPDPATNATYLNVADVELCKQLEPDMFREPLVQTKEGAVFYSGVSNGEAWGHLMGVELILMYIVAGSFLFYVARAQGILHDRLIDEWELEQTHVAALCLWGIATLALLIMCSFSWNGFTIRAVWHVWSGKCIKIFAFCITGTVVVLWKEALSSLRGGSKGSETSDTYDLVFSNKTVLDPLCLEMRDQLQAEGLRVWQQATSIPKDSDNWFTEWYPNARAAKKVVCFINADYIKSPYCMKEFIVAQTNDKLLVVVCDTIHNIMSVSPADFPHASNALAHFDTGGQVIFHEVADEGKTDDVVAEILKVVTEL